VGKNKVPMRNNAQNRKQKLQATKAKRNVIETDKEAFKQCENVHEVTTDKETFKHSENDPELEHAGKSGYR